MRPDQLSLVASWSWVRGVGGFWHGPYFLKITKEKKNQWYKKTISLVMELIFLNWLKKGLISHTYYKVEKWDKILPKLDFVMSWLIFGGKYGPKKLCSLMSTILRGTTNNFGTSSSIQRWAMAFWKLLCNVKIFIFLHFNSKNDP